MDSEPVEEFTTIEELANIPLSDLIEPQWLDMPEIQQQDLELPYDYLQDLSQRGVIGEDTISIDIDARLLEGPEQEQSPFQDVEEPIQERDIDFGR